MKTVQPEKTSRPGWTRLFTWSFMGCLLLIVCSVVPLLAIGAGILTIRAGSVFWGVVLIALGLLALLGPFLGIARTKRADENTPPSNNEK